MDNWLNEFIENMNEEELYALCSALKASVDVDVCNVKKGKRKEEHING